VDAQCLELDLTRGQHLNAAFAALDSAGLKVMSLRNKSNRLEQLFVSLTASEGSAETLVHG
jgi:ABC-2 type transport system ATP-binding protein